LVEIGFLDGASAVLALTSLGPEGHYSSLIVLVLPIAVSAVLVLMKLRADGTPPPQAMSLASVTAWTILGSGLAILHWVRSLGPYFNVTWAMSGDARNHILITREIVNAGGLTASEFKIYPAAIDGIIALVSAAGGRGDMRPGELLLHDATADAAVFALAWLAVSLLLAGTLLEVFGPRARSCTKPFPLGVLIVVLGCALSASSRLALGTALVGGFVDAYAAIALIIGAMLLALRFCRSPSPFLLSLIGLATIVTLVTFPILAVAPALLVICMSPTAFRRCHPLPPHAGWHIAWVTSLALALGAVVFTLVVGYIQEPELTSVFVRPGGFARPETSVLPLMGLLLIGTFLFARTRLLKRQLALVVGVFLVVCLVIHWLMTLPGTFGTWTYYSLKTLWLLICSLLWVPFLPALFDVGASSEQLALDAKPLRHHSLSALRAVAWSGALLIVLGLTTTAPDPLAGIKVGWYSPSATTVAAVVTAANTYPRFLFWQWDGAGEDQIADFWAALDWASTTAGASIPYSPHLKEGLAAWAYEENGTLQLLCDVVESVPHLVVITRNAHLSQQLGAVCPEGDVHFVVGQPL
jgi:hypothetical protein